MSLLLPEEAAHRLGHLSLVRSSSSSSQHDAIVAVGGEEEALADEVGGVAGANTTEGGGGGGGGGGLFFVMDGDSAVYDEESSSSIWHLVWTITLGSFLLLLIVISIVGNVLVCIAIGTDQRLRKLSNLFLVSLAIADLLVAALVMPLALVNDLNLWTMGETVCKAWIAVDVMCSTASIINLCAISLDRYVHIKDPLQYTELITRRSVPLTIAGIWATSALISLLPISLNMHAASTEDEERPEEEAAGGEGDGTCVLDFNPSYSIGSSFISFFIPCFIMLFIYFHVYRFARYHMESIRKQSRPLLRLRRMSEENRQLQQLQLQQQKLRQEQMRHQRLDFDGVGDEGGNDETVVMAAHDCHLGLTDANNLTSYQNSQQCLMVDAEQQTDHGGGGSSNCNNHHHGNNLNGGSGLGRSSSGKRKQRWRKFRDCLGRTKGKSCASAASSSSSGGGIGCVGGGGGRRGKKGGRGGGGGGNDDGDSPLLQEHKAAITIGIIMGVFLLCWAPFFAANVIVGLCKECVPPLLFQILTWLGYSNSVFNPIIYSIFNVEFREAFGKTLRQLRPRAGVRFCCPKHPTDFV